jgi:lipoprotein-releasing system permease protein
VRLGSIWIEWTIALRLLREGRIQSTLILVGIAVGVAVIVFIAALIGGLQSNTIERTLGAQAHVRIEPPTEANVVVAGPAGAVQLVLEDPRAQRLRSINNWQQVQATLDALAGVEAVSPVVSGPGFARRGEALESVALVGIDVPRFLRIVPVDENLVSGEFRVGAGEVVIGRVLAANLGARVGDKLRLDAGQEGEAIVNVAGIFELGVRELDERQIYLDLEQAQALLDLPGGVTVIELTVPEIFAADAVARRIARLLNVKAESWMQTNSELLNALSAQSLSTTMISFFVAVSVAFGIASVLSVTVVQHTREIGILRAMGATQPKMLRVFLLQGAVFGLAGSAIGSFLGYALVWTFNAFGPRLFEVPVEPRLMLTAVALATVTGVLSAALPARRAARLDPVAAIRSA